jgi:hypothetical protein
VQESGPAPSASTPASTPASASSEAGADEDADALPRESLVAYATPGRQKTLEILQFIKLLHLCLDTFELRPYKVLGPGETIYKSEKNAGIQQKAGAAKAGLERKLLSAKSTLGTGIGSKAPPASLKSPTGAERGPESIPVNTEIGNVSIKAISAESTRIITQTLMMIFEECPRRLLFNLPFEEDFAEGNDRLSLSYALSQDAVTNAPMMTLMKTSYALILHALASNQCEYGLDGLFDVAIEGLRRFGARVYMTAVGDSLQFWIRNVLQRCGSQSSGMREAASNFLLYLLRAVHVYYGSITIVADTVLAVVDDVIWAIIGFHKDIITTLDDEDVLLEPLCKSVTSVIETCAKAIDEKGNAAYFGSVIKLMTDLDIQIRANYKVRRHVENLVVHDWHGVNMLDGPFDARTQLVSVNTFKERRMIIGTQTTKTKSMDEVVELFVQASEVYSPLRLPRQRIRWLENLARIHERGLNRAEAAEIRWRIFEICYKVKDSWRDLWAPQPPLHWDKSTERKLTPQSTPSFVTVLANALAQPASRPWVSVEQHTEHMETALGYAIDSFKKLQLIYLAERASHALVDLARQQNKLLGMAQAYEKLAEIYKVVAEGGVNPFAMGTFYWVKYVGLGTPPQFRHEYIYRNATNMHVSEFHVLIKELIVPSVAAETEVRVSQANAPTQADLESKDVVIFITAVRPVYAKSVAPEARNKAIGFCQSVPFTKGSNKAHAKTMDKQWKRNIIFTVPDPFPSVYTRQVVISTTTREVSPIEVAIDDIEERIVAMNSELSSVGKTDENNLMRLVQGTVRPQVNAGAAEVARVFLSEAEPAFAGNEGAALKAPATPPPSSPAEGTTAPPAGGTAAVSSSPAAMAADLASREADARDREMHARLQLRLKLVLMEFLRLSKGLLRKTRRLFLEAPERDPSVGVPESTKAIWQGEMEIGYDKLVAVIYPYISQLAGVEALHRKR